MEIEIIKFLQASANPFFDVVFKAFSYMGSWLGFLVALIVLFILDRKFSIFFAGTYGIGVGINYILKIIIDRPRPFEVDATIYNWLNTVGRSMPSGHTVSAVIIALFVVTYVFMKTKGKVPRILSSIILAIYVLLVMISRMYLGQHFLSDLVVGLLIGVICAVIGLLIYIKRGKICEYFRNHRKKTKSRSLDKGRD